MQDEVNAVIRVGATAAFDDVPELLIGTRHEAFELEPINGSQLLGKGLILGRRYCLGRAGWDPGGGRGVPKFLLLECMGDGA